MTRLHKDPYTQPSLGHHSFSNPTLDKTNETDRTEQDTQTLFRIESELSDSKHIVSKNNKEIRKYEKCEQNIVTVPDSRDTVEFAVILTREGEIHVCLHHSTEFANVSYGAIVGA